MAYCLYLQYRLPWEDNDEVFRQNILVQSLIHLVEEYVVFNISGIVSNRLFLLHHQGLIYKIRAASDMGQKGYIFLKKGHQKFPHLLFNPFLSALQNKALHNFQREQHPIARSIKGLDEVVAI